MSIRRRGNWCRRVSERPIGPLTANLPLTIEPKVYRIRCKATSGPRSRVLSLAAESEEQARSLATRDLGTAWTVLEIREA